jgi:hypothetical protein
MVNRIVRERYRPSRPGLTQTYDRPIPDRLWEVVQAGWNHDPESRPSVFELEELLSTIDIK